MKKGRFPLAFMLWTFVMMSFSQFLRRSEDGRRSIGSMDEKGAVNDRLQID